MNSLLLVKSYRLTRWRKNEGGRVEEILDWLWRNAKTNSNFCQFWWLRNSLNRWKLTLFNGIVQQKLKTKFGTWRKELKSVFLEQNEFENRDASRFSDNTNLWRFQIDGFNRGSKLIVLQSNFPPRVENFRLRPVVEQIKLVATEIQSWSSNRRFFIIGIILAFSDYQDWDARNEINNDQIVSTGKNLRNEVLQLEVKSVVMEN